MNGGSLRRVAGAVATFALVVAAFLGEVIAGRRLYWKSDLSGLMHPLFYVWAECLKRWDFSALLWTPNILAGHPLLAEGQMGAFYPPNWLLMALSPEAAVSGSLVLGYSLTLVATAWLGRLLGMSHGAALASGAVFAFGGFAACHVVHANIVAAIPWLPIVLGLTELGFRRRQWAWWLLAGFCWGAQWLVGHPQVPVMTGLMTVVWVGTRALTTESTWRRRFLAIVVPLFLIVPSALGLTAAYLLPILELGRISIRAGAVMAYADAAFLSLEPQVLVTGILPFFYGPPEAYRGPPTFYEFGFYAGSATLIFAAAAVAVRPRRRWALFFAAIAVVSLLLALGQYTPAYRLAHLLPGLRSLRVPARFVFLLDFGLAMLAGLGMDALAGASHVRAVARGLAVAALGIAAACWAAAGEEAWPSVVALVLGAALLGVAGRMRPDAWRALAVLLILADLWTYWTRVHAHHRVLAHEAVTVDPALAFVASQAGPYDRVARMVRADIHHSNHSILYGLNELGGFAAIPIRRVDHYVTTTEHDDSSRHTLLSLAGVRYVVVDADRHRARASSHEGVEYRPGWPLAVLGRGVPTRVSYVLPGTRADEVRLVGSFGGWLGLPQGSEVVRLTVRLDNGAELGFPLRKGIEVIEPAPAATKGSARSGDVPRVVYREGVGAGRLLLYYVRLPLGRLARIERLTVELADSQGRFGLYGLGFAGGDRGIVPLSPFAREGFRPIHRTDRSVIFENEGALDRAYAVHRVRRARDAADALDTLRAPAFRPSVAVVLEDPDAPKPTGGGPSRVRILGYAPTRVELEAAMQGDGYVVVSDAHHPAWRAFLDGSPVPIYHANAAFRAVYVPDGRHHLVFRFEPSWLRVGAGISLATLAAGAAVAVGLARRRHQTRTGSERRAAVEPG